jgi:hypothetical protein
MGAVNQSDLTLLDLASRMEGNAPARTIIELMNKNNQLLDDMTFEECNQGTHHVTTQRVDIPDGTWRKLNKGVARSKSVTAQIKDEVAMLEAESLVDEKLLSLSGNRAKTLMTESKPYIEGISQQFVRQVVYGTRTDPEKFPGLIDRYGSLSSADGGANPVASSDNVIDGGGTGSTNTSIWIVGWGDDKIHGIYPKGSKAGIDMKDTGTQRVLDENGDSYLANSTRFMMDGGLAVRDWRFAVRICNIDVALLTKDASTGADVLDLLIQGVERMYNLSGKNAIYCNRLISTYLRRQMVNRPGTLLSLEQIAGKKVVAFDGIPVRRLDEITSNEEAVA